MSDNKLNIDDLLDDAKKEDDANIQLEALEAEKAKLQEELDAFKEKEEEEEKEKKEEEKKEEEKEVDPVMKEMNDKLKALEEKQLLDDQMKVTSGMLELEEKYTDLFKNEDVMKSPVIAGAEVSVKEYIESLLSTGNMKAAEKTIETVMKLNSIKVQGSTLPLGGGGGDNNQKMDDETKKKSENIRKMFAAMDKGSYKATVAKKYGKI